MNLAVIPARGGSKRLPGKNVIELDGKPLIHYTLEAAVNSGCFDTIILSSDDDEILEIGAMIEGVTPEKRPEEYSGDKVKVIEWIKAISDRPGYAEKFEKIALLLPTCPFRTAQHIKEGMQLLQHDDLSVVSTCEMEDPVQLSMTIDEDHVADLSALINPSPLVTGQTRSQDFNKYYRVNGGFYIAWMDKFRRVDNFFQGRVKAYKMDKLNSVDIDYQINLEWAEYLLKNNRIKL
jgi:CMP-N,N'-diacetyllegionaminic acid synthase